MLYWILASIIKLVLKVFFRRIESHGTEKIPTNCPLVFVANHPNMAMDPFLVGLNYDRPIHFMAKSTLFRPAPIGWLLRTVGVLPVYRRSDDPSKAGKNEDIFRECYHILERKETICLFPEGGSYAVPYLSPFKTGAARIVFGAEEKNDFALGVRIVPVGLYYVHRDEFRSDVLVQFGDPIDPSTYFDSYKRDSHEAVNQLTHQMQNALTVLTENLQKNQDWNVVRKLQQLYIHGLLVDEGSAPPENLKAAFDLDRGLVDAHAHFAVEQPERTGRVTEDIETYLLIVQMLGLSDRALTTAGRRRSAILRLAVELFFLVVIGVPIWLYGLITNYLPYRLTGRVTSRFTSDPVEPATYKVFFGGVFHITYYTLLAALIGWKFGMRAAGLSFLSFPVLGLLTLEVYDRLTRCVQTLRTLFIFRVDQQLATRLSELRHRIMSELTSMRDEWMKKDSPEAGVRSPEPVGAAVGRD